MQPILTRVLQNENLLPLTRLDCILIRILQKATQAVSYSLPLLLVLLGSQNRKFCVSRHSGAFAMAVGYVFGVARVRLHGRRERADAAFQGVFLQLSWTVFSKCILNKQL